MIQFHVKQSKKRKRGLETERAATPSVQTLEARFVDKKVDAPKSNTDFKCSNCLKIRDKEKRITRRKR